MKQKGEIVVKKVKKSTSLVLRCCRSDMSSKNGFVWPGVGEIATAPDWQDNNECGNGLHGWLYGQGDYRTSDFATDPDAKWLVVQVEDAAIRMLGGKCKFPSGKVVFVGSKSDAADYIVEHEPKAKNVAVIGRVVRAGDGEQVFVGSLGTATAGYRGTATAGNYGTATAGNRGTATAGNHGTATAGNYGTATAGEPGTATAGNYGTATAGESGTATAGYYGTATAGNYGTATAGYRGTATAGYRGTATAGNYGTATAGESGTATAGNYGTATAGESGTATAGESGEIRIQYWDSAAQRYRTKIGYVGEDGIKPNVAYRLDDKHQIVEAI